MEEITQEQINVIVQNTPLLPVYSFNIQGIGYNEQSKNLRVLFKGGGNYIYFNVEPEIYEQIKTSQSKGKTLNESVVKHKDKYKYIRINK